MTRHKSSTNQQTRKCQKTFCRKLNALTRRNLTRMNIPNKELQARLKTDSKYCKRDYCTINCKGSKLLKSKIFSKFLKNGFYEGTDISKMKSLGALSACSSSKPFIKGTRKEESKGWDILNDFE